MTVLIFFSPRLGRIISNLGVAQGSQFPHLCAAAGVNRGAQTLSSFTDPFEQFGLLYESRAALAYRDSCRYVCKLGCLAARRAGGEAQREHRDGCVPRARNIKDRL